MPAMSALADIENILFLIHLAQRALPRLRTPIAILRKVLYVVAFFAFPTILLLLASPIILAAFWSVFRSWAACSISGRILGTACFAFIGGAFYLIRERHRGVYGTAEVLIGVFGCWAALANIQAETLAHTVTLSSS